MNGRHGGDRAVAWFRLASVLLLAVILRVAGLGSHSLWFDEAITMTLARQPDPVALRQALGQLDATRAPLHPLLLQGWLTVFGSSDLAGRALSAVLGSLAVALVYWVGRQAFDESTALWASGLMAISPVEVEYSQEVRMYALLVVLTCGCWGILLSFRRSATVPRQLALTLGLIALVYTHPLGGLMVVALALGALLLAPESRLTMRAWCWVHVALLVAIAPWATRYLDHPPDLKYPKHYQATNWPKAFLGGVDWAVYACYALAVAGCLNRGWAGSRTEGTESPPARGSAPVRDPATTAALLVWFLVPPLLIHLYSVARHPIAGPIRYVLYVGPAFLLLVARGIVRLPGPARVVVAGVLAGLAVPQLRDRVYDPDAKPDWRAAAAVVRQTDPRSSVILFCSNGHFYVPTLRYYLDPGTNLAEVYQYGSPSFPTPEPAVWYVADRIDGIHQVPPLLDQLYEPVRSWRFGRLTLSYNQLRRAGSPQRSRPEFEPDQVAAARRGL